MEEKQVDALLSEVEKVTADLLKLDGTEVSNVRSTKVAQSKHVHQYHQKRLPVSQLRELLRS